MNLGGGDELFDPHLKLSAIAALAAGPMFIAVLASVISRRGLGNGFAVIIVASWLWAMPWFDLPFLPNTDLAMTVLEIVITVVIARALFGWRVRSPGRVAIPLPASSISPMHDGGGAVSIIATLTAIGVALPIELVQRASTLQGSLLIGGIALGVFTVVWSFAFARPGRRSAELAAAGLQPANRELWLRATILSGVPLAALFAIALVRPVGVLGRLCDPALVIIAAATFGDLAAEWRARRSAPLVAVWSLHDPLLVDAARDRLGEIPHFIQATRMRSLLWIFGAYVPMTVFVPADRADEALTTMRDWLASSHQS